MVDEIKKRRVTKKDFDRIRQFVMDEYAARKGRKTREEHETIWKEVDRQIAMQKPDSKNRSKDPDEEWHSAIQLGNLADAMEIISADILRMSFPIDRKWFAAHAELPLDVNEQGQPVIDPMAQQVTDGVLRSLMNQQHADFGFKKRVKASIKEALSHGGIVVEVRFDTMTKQRNGRIQKITSPVWIPHSMWNCYPDPSPSVMGTDLFYRGSMIIKSFMNKDKFRNTKVFMNKDKVKIPEKEKDVEMITYFGDISLDRQDGDIFLPNYKAVVANDVLVFAEPLPLSYPNIIYTGYEKDSLMDEYYTSPLIKRAPANKLATNLMNKFVDGSELKNEPPVIYDSYDTTLVQNGGVKIYPGSSTGAKGGAANFKVVDIGDPSFMFQAYLQLKEEVERGTGVDATRSGVSASTDQTAFEVAKKDQRGEVRTVDFTGVLDREALKPFLYMQHDMNLVSLENYPFFNNEIHTPDFLRWSKGDLPKNVVFEVVGSKEVLGEEQRNAKFGAAIQASSAIPQVSQRTNWETVTQEVWNFSGVKDPERFVVDSEEANEIQQIVEQFQQQIGELQGQIQQLEADVQISEIEREELELLNSTLQQELKLVEEQKQTITTTAQSVRNITNAQHKLELLRERIRQSQNTNSKT